MLYAECFDMIIILIVLAEIGGERVAREFDEIEDELFCNFGILGSDVMHVVSETSFLLFGDGCFILEYECFILEDMVTNFESIFFPVVFVFEVEWYCLVHVFIGVKDDFRVWDEGVIVRYEVVEIVRVYAVIGEEIVT